MHLIIKDNTAYRYANLGNGFAGHVPVPCYKGEPTMSWSGGKMPLALWQQMLVFFKQTYESTKSETQVRFFYNRQTREWRIWAFPQKHKTGMTAEDLPDHLEFAPQMQAMLEGGFEVFGTGHHHCSTSAFQSSVDHKDERQYGLHVTVGHLDKETFDVHARVSLMLPGILSADQSSVVQPAQHAYYNAVDLTEWVDIPESMLPPLQLPQPIRDMAVRYYLTSMPDESVTIPAQWISNLIEIKSTGYWTPNSSQVVTPGRFALLPPSSIPNSYEVHRALPEHYHPRTPDAPSSETEDILAGYDRLQDEQQLHVDDVREAATRAMWEAERSGYTLDDLSNLVESAGGIEAVVDSVEEFELLRVIEHLEGIYGCTWKEMQRYLEAEEKATQGAAS